MRRTKKKACRGSGRLRGAVGGERYADSSGTPKPPSCVERIPARRMQALRWAAHLQPCEAAVLVCMMELQPADGAPFAVTYAQVSEALGVSHALVYAAVHGLCQRGLLEKVERGNAGRANQYRVPPQLPQAPSFCASTGGAKGGAE